jgi:hypothetical protein
VAGLTVALAAVESLAGAAMALLVLLAWAAAVISGASRGQARDDESYYCQKGGDF